MDARIEEIDYARVAMLLSIQQKAAAHGALLGALMSEGMTELLKINAVAQSNVAERADEAQQNQSFAAPKTLAAAPEIAPAKEA